MHLNIAIVGRPNVGKSTLFNKLIHKKSAIVFDTPGITRDRIEKCCKIGKIDVKLIDTAGFDNTKTDEISEQMVLQSLKAIEDAHAIFFIIDARQGITQLDVSFAKILRKIDKKIVLICNKAEGKVDFDIQSEIYSLGFSDILFISAEHKIGFREINDKITQIHKEKFDYDVEVLEKIQVEAKEYIDKTAKLSIAIVGRPNAGKSTIFNTLLQKERSIVSEVAGTTRDAIHQTIIYKDCEIDLVDTAGIRKKLNITDEIESLSVASAFTAVNFATVVILCMDTKLLLDSQDLKIAQYAIQEGRGIIIVINKWDLLNEKERINIIGNIEEKLNKTFPRIRNMPFFTISGKFDENLDEILNECIILNDIWSKRINTFKLNSFIREIVEKSPPPRYKGHVVKIKYATQIKTRPMSVLIFTNFASGIKESYLNFLENEIRNKFGIFGVPIRISLKKSDNPYAKS